MKDLAAFALSRTSLCEWYPPYCLRQNGPVINWLNLVGDLISYATGAYVDPVSDITACDWCARHPFYARHCKEDSAACVCERFPFVGVENDGQEQREQANTGYHQLHSLSTTS